MPGKRRGGKGWQEYYEKFERFRRYVHILREEALQLIQSLPPNDEKVVTNFFNKYYKEEKEHYWSITKLFAHAMYIPMFLQIGRKHFDRLVYIDTHSGPGLARIGPDPDEVVLGSPLIALKWPEIVASNVNQYKGIRPGFDILYFIDKDWRRTDVLQRLVDRYGYRGKTVVVSGDSNYILPRIIEKELEKGEKVLFYIFIDPYGDVDSQLRADAIKESLGKVRADVLVTVFDAHISRAFSGRPNPDLASRLFGSDFCSNSMRAADVLCRFGDPGRDDVRDAFRYVFESNGFTRVEFIPVKHGSVTIYNLMLAVKDPTSPWVDGYLEYLREMIPKPEVLRQTWKTVTRRQATLDSYM